jgi:hypothetical protein
MNAMRRYTSIGVTAGVIAGGALGFGLSVAGLTSAGPGQSSSTPAPVNAASNAAPFQAAPPKQVDQLVEDADQRIGPSRIGPSQEQIEKMHAHWEDVQSRIEAIRTANAERLAQRLAPLVDNGTLSQDQVDAIVSHLQADHTERAAEMRTRMVERFGEMRPGRGPRP